jgi:GTP-binding protein EngB required for normal cell division
MKKFLIILTIICFFPILFACQTVTNKIDEKSTKEEKKLSKWLNQTESDLKIVFGKPDRIEFLETRNRYYIYVSKKLNIKCERKFEINSNNTVVGFSSKNCF